MNPALQRRFLLLPILLLSLSVWWIHSMCFRCSLQVTEREKILNHNDIEENEAYQIAKSNIQSEMISNDNNDQEVFPLVIRPIHEYIDNENYLRGTNEDDVKGLEELRKLLQGNLLSKDNKFDEDFLKLYIRDSNYNVDKAFSKIRNLIYLEMNHEYFFRNINFDFSKNPAYRFVTFLPHRHKDGSVTILFEAAKWNPDEVPFEHFKQIMFLIYVQELRNPLTQASGFRFICDFADVGFRYLKYVTPENVFLLNHVLADVLPTIFVGIHLINVNFIGNLLVTLSRPFLPAFVEKMLYMHSSVKDLLDFYHESMLPVQYGGTLEDYYMSEWIRKANEEHKHFTVGGQKNIDLNS